MAESGANSSSRFRKNAKHTKLFCWSLLAACCAASLPGCKKSLPAPLEPAQIHAITREFAAAATSSAPSGTRVWTTKRASAGTADAADGVAVAPPIGTNKESGRTAVAKIMQAVAAVATRHHLTQDPPSANYNSVRLTFRRAGRPTHEIEIVTRWGDAAGKEQLPAGPAGSGARLAIILDDIGSDRAAAEAIFSLPYPLTISVLPHHPHSEEIASEAHRRGYEVMLHLPMQAVGEERPEPEELRPGMSAAEVTRFVDQMIEAVPYADGVNNHQGSQATADRSLMEELMPALRERGLFYIDSRTTAATVAYDMARKDNVQTAFRSVPFLDDVEEAGAVRRQLQLAMRGAREKGEAIAIGHPHPATLQALSEMLPRAQAEGLQLVFASELVH